MTYNVFGGTLNLAQPTNRISNRIKFAYTQQMHDEYGCVYISSGGIQGNCSRRGGGVREGECPTGSAAA